MRVYLLLIWTWTRAAARYPVSFTLMTVGGCVTAGLDVAVIWVIFANTTTLGGLGLSEVMFLYGAAWHSRSPTCCSATPTGSASTSGRAPSTPC